MKFPKMLLASSLLCLVGLAVPGMANSDSDSDSDSGSGEWSCGGCKGVFVPGTLICGDDNVSIHFELSNSMCDPSAPATSPDGKCAPEDPVNQVGECKETKPCFFYVRRVFNIPATKDSWKIIACQGYIGEKKECVEWETPPGNYTGCTYYSPECGKNYQVSHDIGDCNYIYTMKCSKCKWSND